VVATRRGGSGYRIGARDIPGLTVAPAAADSATVRQAPADGIPPVVKVRPEQCHRPLPGEVTHEGKAGGLAAGIDFELDGLGGGIDGVFQDDREGEVPEDRGFAHLQQAAGAGRRTRHQWLFLSI
jgi:hypothetical protein